MTILNQNLYYLNEGIRNVNLQRGIIGVEGEWKSQRSKPRQVFKTKNSNDL
jgi:hypothetical protein